MSRTDPDSDGDTLADLTRWTYALTYTLPIHYPHDEVSGTLEFNVRPTVALPDDRLEDAVPQIAQLVSVLGPLRTDISELVAPVDATTKKADVHDAKVAMDVLKQLLGDIVGAGGDSLEAVDAPKLMAGDPLLTYAFTLSEGAVSVGGEAAALLVTLRGKLPQGVGAPSVEIDPDTWTCEP